MWTSLHTVWFARFHIGVWVRVLGSDRFFSCELSTVKDSLDKSTHLIREGVFLVSFEAFDSHWKSLPLGASDIAEAPALSVLHINGKRS